MQTTDTGKESLFNDTNVQICSSGRPYLGSPIGSPDYVSDFVNSKVQGWCQSLSALSDIAKIHPHAAYSAFIHGISSWWTFLCRTTPDIGHLLNPLEHFIRTDLLPVLTGQGPPNDITRSLLSLPARMGGMGIAQPTNLGVEYDYSCHISSPLVSLITSQINTYSPEVFKVQLEHRGECKSKRASGWKNVLNQLESSIPEALQLPLRLAAEKGASSWLTSLPIKSHGFALHKAAFRDAIALRYGWDPSHLPTECACGKAFRVDHALMCPKGGFPTLRHNEVRDITADLVSQVCSNVCIEPTLQNVPNPASFPSSSNTTEGARLDVAADGFWGGNRERMYLDVRVFNPFAPSNARHSIPEMYKTHEREKKRQYELRIREVEHGSFTPLVMSCTGGYAKESTVFFKRLANLLAAKWNKSYSSTMNWIKSSLTFSLLRSSIRCLRGHRSSCGQPVRVRLTPDIDVVCAEAMIT